MKYYILIIILSLISCKEKNNHQKNITIQSNIEDEYVDFLKYIDSDIGFRENFNNSNIAEAWLCRIENNQAYFSGYTYLVNNNEVNDAFIEKINSSNYSFLHEKFDMISVLVEKDHFMPFNKMIDNPCENYKKEITYSVYFSSKGKSSWKYIGNTSIGFNINQILEKYNKK